MKKTFVITALVMGLGFIGLQQVSASPGMGAGCPKGGPGYSQLDAATKAKVDKFYDDTNDLRKQMVMKHAEERAIMRSENPDSDKVAKLAGEIFDLKTTIQAKADAAGVQEVIGCGDCQGMGMGPGMGHQGMMGKGMGKGMMNAGPHNMGDGAANTPAAKGDAQ